MLGAVPVVALITVLAVRSSAAPKRAHITCAEGSAAMKRATGLSLKAGDWANLPAALRVLPPKAELCGSLGLSVIIASPLFGKELGDFYRPLFEKANCKPLDCEVTATKTVCTCGGGKRVATEEPNEVYNVTWF